MAQLSHECSWGILGCGAISSDFCRALRLTEGAKVTAVAARSLARARDFAAKHDIPEAFGSYEELAEAPNVDVVYVGTINPAHYDNARLMIQHGKHVVCEKPMCMNHSEVASLVSLARAKGVFLMEGMWTRFFPAVEKALELVKSGKIGHLVEVISDFGFASKVSEDSRLYNLDLGGGGLLDVGIYVLASVAFVWGCEPSDIRAVGWLEPTGADSCGVVALKFGPGWFDSSPLQQPRIAALTYSMRTATREWTVYQGTRGKLALWPSHCPTQLHVEVDGDSPQVLKFPLPEPSSNNFTNSSGFIYQARRVHELLAAGATECPEWPLDTSAQMARLMDTIRAQIGVIYPRHDGMAMRLRALLLSLPSASRWVGAFALLLAFAYARARRSSA